MRDAGDIDLSSTSTWGTAPTGEFTVDYELRLDAPAPVVRFVCLTRCGEVILGERLIWQQQFDRLRHAKGVFEWMVERQEIWPFWGRLARLTGPDRLFADAAADVARTRSGRAAELARARVEARTARARRKEISSFLVEEDGQFGVDLTRGDERDGFFVLWFRERWERERFRDWWRAQHDRFPDFATLHDAQGAAALERMLLREMQDTEKRIKAAGLGAGGRRPLRFYRGEE